MYLPIYIRNENHNKLKYRVILSDVWLSDRFDSTNSPLATDTSFVIGWPPATNYVADFKDALSKGLWFSKLNE